MKFEIKINPQFIECMMAHIKWELMKRYGCDTADREIEPLEWYVGTGRASLEFIRKLSDAKPFMVARKLHMGGSTDEVIARVKTYINY